MVIVVPALLTLCHQQEYILAKFLGAHVHRQLRSSQDYLVSIEATLRGSLLNMNLRLGIVSILVSVWLAARFFKSSKAELPTPSKFVERERIYALSTLFTTSVSSNSGTYQSLLPPIEYTFNKEKEIKRTLSLKLSSLLNSVRAGHLEVDKIDEIVSLFQHPKDLSIPGTGWTFSLSTELSWWTRTALWMIRSELAPIPSDLWTHQRAIDLDYVPAPKLAMFLERFLRSLSEPFLTIQMTCLAPSVGSFTREFVWAALPFILSFNTDWPALTATPFTVSVQQVSTLLAKNQQVIIISMKNISNDSWKDLLKHQTSLEISRDVRETSIKMIGIEGWREKRGLLAWRAAALKAGVLQRWEIVLRKRDHAVVS